ncbi:MAG: polysaccharide deacetylase family protein [Desulfobacteraceae bacterium]|jgi:peptidoglycan/xylan/chitin deacetylase (PgdA/CDA1 family)
MKLNGKMEDMRMPVEGIFTISLDFELHWGSFEKWPLQKYKQYFENTRKIIPKLLDLFKKSDIHVTWATVGLLMHENKHTAETNFPKIKPGYMKRDLSAYEYIKEYGIGVNEKEDPFHFADSIIRRILSYESQELGSHTFSHYYCYEDGQNKKEFREDLSSAQKAASAYNTRLISLVFPRNQFNKEYLRICHEKGIGIVRTNPANWWWNVNKSLSNSMHKRLVRGLDAYFNIGGKTTSYSKDSIKKIEAVYLLPASRFLRPYRIQEMFLNKNKINRVMYEMKVAAERKEIYHLWWHPHNFGFYPEQNLNGLEEIINCFDMLRSKYKMISLNMGEIYNFLEYGCISRPSALS